MFERDKNELRDLGIPLETGRVSPFDPTEGYRINRDAYALPAVELTADEAAAVAVATQLWESPELITATQGALLKLRAAGVDVDARDAGVAITRRPACPGIRGSEEVLGNPVVRHQLRSGRAVPAPAVAQRAVHDPHRRAVGCGDRPRPLVSRRPRPRPRRHPHVPAVAHRRRGRQPIGPAGAVDQPDGVDLREIVHRVVGETPTGDAGQGVGRRRARHRAAPAGARRSARGRSAAATARRSAIDIGMSDRLAREIAGYGADAVVLEPQSLRDDVLARLRAQRGRSAHEPASRRGWSGCSTWCRTSRPTRGSPTPRPHRTSA